MLPLCVHIDPATNALVAAGEFTGECTGYVLITPADWAGSMTIAELFGTPEPLLMTAAFASFFGLVFGPAAIAHLVGRVSGMFDHTTNEEL
jgi:hypothetical protein